MTNDDLIKLIERSAVNIYSLDTLKEKLKSDKKLIIKFGADPSRPDLHLGHTVPLRILKAFQEAGHEIVFLIGDFTAMIGDPSGRSKTRPSLTYEQTRKNSQTYLEQVAKILDINKVRIVFNSEWLSKMTFEDVIKLASKYTVARIMERDDFAKRYKDNQPISIHEMLYPLMQGYDSVALHADVEIGGTDQTFNILVGRELQRDYDQTPQDVITFPLLVGLDGVEKMSKSLDNYIGISDAPEIMFEKCMKVPDSVLQNYFALTTSIDLTMTEKMIKDNPVDAHILYAKTIVEMYHGKEETEEAYGRYKKVASGGVPQNLTEIKMESKEVKLIDCVMKANFCNSTSEARRLIQQNGIKVNGAPENKFDKIIDLSQETIISKGKNNFVKIIF